MKKFIFSTCIGAVLMLAGCQESDELVSENAAKPFTVTANIQGSASSRVVLTPGEDSNQNPIVRVTWRNDESNKEDFKLYFKTGFTYCYTFTQTTGNQFTCASEVPDGAIPLFAVYGKHEYNSSSEYITYDFSEQDGALNDEDFLMTAENITDLTQPIEFKHKTAILKVTFKQDGFDVDTSVSNFTMGNVLSGVGNTITMNRTILDDDIYVFLPINTAYTEGRKFTFDATVAGEACTGSITIPQGMTVEAGKYYTANVTLSNKYGKCKLPTGIEFNDAIKSLVGNNSNVKTIQFVPKSQETGGTRIGSSRAFAKVVNDNTLKIYTTENKFVFDSNCYFMFGGLKYITKIDWGSSFSTYGVGDMSYMFSGCEKLTSVNFPYDEDEPTEKFSVFGVSTMEGMFKNCKAVQQLDLSEFAFGYYISDMSSMFKGCSSLTNIIVDTDLFITNTVSNMSSMFEGCSALTSVPTLQTNWVTDMSNMFKGCSSLTNFDVNWTSSSNVNMSNMFNECNALTKVAFGENFKPTATDMNNMFYYCYMLESIDLRNFTITASTNCENIFFIVGQALEFPKVTQIYVTDEVKEILNEKGTLNNTNNIIFNTGTPPAN